MRTNKTTTIKRCHGDLKSPHIWITPYTYISNSEPWMYVRVLDAIDFNPTYCNIDILSDLAMLILDIQARTKSSEITSQFVKDYLLLTSKEREYSSSTSLLSHRKGYYVDCCKYYLR